MLPAERRSSPAQGERGPGADVTGLARFARGSGVVWGGSDARDGGGEALPPCTPLPGLGLR